MSVSVDEDAIHAMAANPESPVGQLILQQTIAVEAVVKVLLKIPGSGRLYLPGEYFLKRGGKIYHWVRHGPAHRASAPGEPPAGDTGYLAASIEHEIVVRETVVGIVRAKADYGLYNELGTVFMKARPYLRPALSAVIGKTK